MDLRNGTVLQETWRIERALGRGGMAAVYEAVHVRNGLRVAIKVLHAALADDERVRFRFLREGYVENKIGHPGVVRVLHDGTDGEHMFLVMELVVGESLKQRWRNRGQRLPFAELGPIATQMLDALSAAHARGVVHRDIKPDNVLLAEDGAVKLADFGIARLVHADPHAFATETGATLGTPAFMAPEQALARWSDVDARSDVFALGATLFTMLSGRLVHVAQTLPELLVAAATKQAEPVRSCLPELQPAIAAVIDRALRFDRAERFEDAGAMKVAWERALAQPAVPQVKTQPLIAVPAGAHAPVPDASEPSAPHLAPPAASAPSGAGLTSLSHSVATHASPARAVASVARTSNGWRLVLALMIVAGSVGGAALVWRMRAGEEPSLARARNGVVDAFSTVSLPSASASNSAPSALKDLADVSFESFVTALEPALGKKTKINEITIQPWGASVRASAPDDLLTQTFFEWSFETKQLRTRNTLQIEWNGDQREYAHQFFGLRDIDWQVVRGALVDAKARFLQKTSRAGELSWVEVSRTLGVTRIRVGVESPARRVAFCYDAAGANYPCSTPPSPQK